MLRPGRHWVRHPHQVKHAALDPPVPVRAHHRQPVGAQLQAFALPCQLIRQMKARHLEAQAKPVPEWTHAKPAAQSFPKKMRPNFAWSVGESARH